MTAPSAADRLRSRLRRAREKVAGEGVEPGEGIPRWEGEGAVPLSTAQERLWFLERLLPGTPLYNIGRWLALRGALDSAALEAALGRLVARHQALRTRFVERDGAPVQEVVEAPAVGLPRVDLTALPGARRKGEAERVARRQARLPFDVRRAPLLRAALLVLETDEDPPRYVLVLTVHHLVFDGWSMGVLLRDLSALYGQAAGPARSAADLSELPELPELAIQYPDFAAWERSAGEERWREGLEWWRGELAGLGPLDLPADRPRGVERSLRGGHVAVELPARTVEALRRLAADHGASLFMVLLAGWKALLARYSGAARVAVGTPVANRPHRETEELVGFFVNTLALATDLAGDPTAAELVERVRRGVLAAMDHQEVPFARVVEALAPDRNLAHAPLFETMLGLQEVPRRRLDLPRVELEEVAIVHRDVVDQDLNLQLEEGPDGRVVGALLYDADLFDRTTVLRLAGHFGRLLEGMVQKPTTRLADLPMLGAAERHQLVHGWNDTEVAGASGDRERGSTLAELLLAQMARTPQAPALVMEEDGAVRTLTYGQLRSRASRLAHHLRSLGVGPEVRVGVAAERSFELVEALVAVWLAGGAYVPLDPGYPADRLAYMVEDSRVPVVLSQQRVVAALPADLTGSDVPWLRLDADRDLWSHHPTDPPDVDRLPDCLAYVIYTSGSTGRPKGAMNGHRGVVNRLLWMRRAFRLDASDRGLQKTPFSFDVSVWELFAPLVSGGVLVLARPEGHKEPAYLSDLVARQGITTLHFVPPMLGTFLEQDGLAESCRTVRRVICSGEALPRERVERFFQRMPPTTQLHNLYGPTEAAIEVTAWRCRPGDRRPSVPIGRPLDDVRIHVLDRRGRPAPVGVPGELHIGGVAVARGYWGRPGLTAERFVADPLAAEFSDAADPHYGGGHYGGDNYGGGHYGGAGARLYRTGDLARHRAGGEVEFLGRLDHQVKVRGFRIELGEVEAVLADHPAVREAVVVARGERLLGYVVLSTDLPDAEAALRAHLGETLPEYMVPQAIVALDSFPLSPNGKVDRRALPEPERVGGETAYEEPRGEVEGTVAALYAEVLSREGAPVERVGRRDDFFRLGGHSLLATRLVARLRERVGIDLPVRRVFDSPTVAALAEAVEVALAAALAAGGAGGSEAPPPLVRVPRDGSPLPVSSAQRRLWFLEQLEPAAYNMPAAIQLSGPLSVRALTTALSALLVRHEVLRTVFPARDGEPVQEVLPLRAFHDFGRRARVPLLPRIDLTALPESRRSAEERRLGREEGSAAFDLAAGPPIRFRLVELSAERAVLLFTAHHAVSDGWSTGLLLRDLAALYGAATEPENASIAAAELARSAGLSPLPVQYADYAAWERTWLRGEVLERQLAHWRRELDSVPVLELPTDRPRPAVLRQRGRRLWVTVPAEVGGRLRRFAREHGATPFMTLLAAFGALLARYSGQSDFAVGTPVAGRRRSELEALVGFFVNTLALRLKVGLEVAPELAPELAPDEAGRVPSLARLVARAREATLEGHAHQDVPFERVVEELAPRRDLSRTPLFQVMLILQNAFEGSELELEAGGLAMALASTEATTSKFETTLSLEERRDGGFAGWWVYRTDLFDAATARRMAGHFGRLLAAAVEQPEVPFSELPLLSAAEQQQVQVEWNDPRVEYPSGPHLLLPAMVERQVAATPEATALEWNGDRLAYGELWRRSERLARHLRARGVGPEVRVGLAAERSFDLVVGLLGILRSGGAWVPLDPELPEERLELLVHDAGLQFVLTQPHLVERLPGLGGTDEENADAPRLLLLGEEVEAEVGSGPPLPPVLADAAAYVLYTSGSTGVPKGVVVDHATLANRMGFARASDYGPGDAFLHKTTLSFDVSILEVFGPLVAGGRVVVARPGGAQDPAYLVELMGQHGVTQASFPPVLLEALIDEPGFPALSTLRTVVTGGETVPARLPGRLHARLPTPDLLNRYGPTEATISVTSWTCRPDVEERVLPIGRPTAKATVHLLDRRGEPVPVGVPGEIHLGGPVVARGYLGRPARTAAAFVPDRFSALAGARLYRTGDLARWRPDGALEFIGRTDRQVKVRGFRIELGEIEAALRRLPQVQEAAVVDLPDGASRKLAAYVVPARGAASAEDGLPRDGGAGVLRAALRSALASHLPEYMVPAAFVVLDALPLGATGKVDRSALPEPELARESGYVEPRTDAEGTVAALFSEVLGVERVGAEDDFFALGGHSLLVTRLVARLRDRLGIELSVRQVFESLTVAALARVVEAEQATVSARGDRGDQAGSAPLEVLLRDGGLQPASFGQERLWFLDRLDPGRATYSIPLLVDFAPAPHRAGDGDGGETDDDGRRDDGRLEEAALAAAVALLHRRHESLRTTLVETATDEGGRVEQRIGPPPSAREVLPRVDLAALPAARRDREADRLARQEARRPFDLAAGPLWRFRLLRLGGGRARLLVNAHHAVSDGWSTALVLRELAALYRQPDLSSLPALPIQYADYAAWQRKRLRGARLKRLLAWWRQRLAGVPVLELPTDRPRPLAPDPTGRAHRRVADLPAARLAEPFRGGATPFMVGLAAYGALLARHAGQHDFAVGAPLAGRERSDLEGLVGFFVNTLALRLDLAGDPSFADLVDRVRESLLEADAHQELPFEKVVEALAPRRDRSVTPLFQVTFTFGGMVDPGRGASQPTAAAEKGEEAGEDALPFPGLRAEPRPLDPGLAKFDLELSLGEAPDGRLSTLWSHRADLLDGSTVARMARHFEVLLAAALEAPEAPLSRLPLLTAAEHHQLLAEWSGETSAYPRHWTVADAFRAAAAAHPERVALTVAETGAEVTYRQLAERAEALARRLAARGVGADVRVALLLDRTPEAIEALAAIVLAGGAYVPLDPEYPDDRLSWVLSHARPRLVLTRGDLLGRLEALARPQGEALPPTLLLDGSANDGSAPLPRPQPENLAYVLYTSGSTGTPKGVAIPHRGVVRLVLEPDYLPLARGADGWPVAEETILQVAPLPFDASTGEIWCALANGCRLVLAPRGPFDPDRLARTIRETRVTRMWLTAGLLSQMVDAETGALGGLRQLLSGGDVVSRPHVERLLREHPDLLVTPCYGPTECTFLSTAAPLRRPADLPATTPLGRSISDTRTYLLDRRLEPVPVGVTGEIWHAGDGLARGYLDDPARTAAAFLPDPFAAALPTALEAGSGERMYRTGDLGRWLPDGRVEFLGRADHQVKVRGYRIEPGEVEAALAAHPAVASAVVLAVGGDAAGKRLVAWVARDPEGAAPEPGELAAFLRDRLPPYMVPGSFGVLDELPLTAHGKIDRRALERMMPEDRKADAVEPRTPTERRLAALFAEVLGLEGSARVGVDDDFFDLGGHSLLATRLLSRLRRDLGREVPVRVVFEAPTVAALAEYLDGDRQEAPVPDATVPDAPVPDTPVAGMAGEAPPLSFAQQRLWFLDRLDPGSGIYNVPTAQLVEGPLSPAALAAALAALVRRQHQLRTVFAAGAADGGEGEEDAPVQRLLPVEALTGQPGGLLPQVDLSALPEERRHATAKGLLRREGRRPFDLERGPLWRFLLLRLGSRDGADRHLFAFNAHHVVSDGWSLGIFLDELAAFYVAAASTTAVSNTREGRLPALPELPIQYVDFAVWQRRWLAGGELERQLGYWREKLAGLPRLELPTDRPRPAVQTFAGASVRRTLPMEPAAALQRLAREHRASGYMAVLAVLQVLLSRYSGQDDFAVGTPVAGRNRAEVEDLVGFFVNTLVLRAELAPGPDGRPPTFATLLERVREGMLEAQAHQDLPFEKLVEELAPRRDLSTTPLFQVLFNHHRSEGGARHLGEARVRMEEVSSGMVKFDLTLSVGEAPDGALNTAWSYRTDLFDAATVERLAGHFGRLLAAAMEGPETPVTQLPLLSAEERRQLLDDWGEGGAVPGGETATTLAELVRAQAERTPQAVALVGPDGGEVAYAELVDRAEALARRLAALGVGPEVRVAVCLERTPRLVEAILGVLFAGGAYVPLDPAYPAERLAFMLADSAAAVALVEGGTAGVLPDGFAGQRLHLGAPGPAMAESGPALCLSSFLSSPWPSNLAYLIYTSGSTGRPKGVAVEHRSAVARVRWSRQRFTADELSGVLAATSVCFDLSAWELFVPLSAGGRVVLAADALALPDHPARDAVTLVNTVPSAMGELVRSAGLPPSVVTVNLAGEPLPRRLADEVYATGHVERLYNLYGPSEDTTYSTWRRVATSGEVRPEIGRPLAGTRAYVLDRHLQPVPPGVPGELYLAGAGLARGYLGRPALTAGRWLPDPFAAEAREDGAGADGPGARMYRTGDRVRWLPPAVGGEADPGQLDYLGRLDHQVKVRGFRIELGEIEAALLALPAVREAIVLPRGDGADKTLVAYVSPEQPAQLPARTGEARQGRLEARGPEQEPAPATDPPLAPAALSAALARTLPDSMVPSAWVFLEALPRTPNGKVDRAALAAIEPDRRGAGYVAPRTAGEELLASFFAEVLGLERVGVDDDFFTRGGHSLLAVRLMARIGRATGERPPLDLLFQHPTVARLAAALDRRGLARAEPAGPDALVPLATADGTPQEATAAPLVLVHPGGGDLLSYVHLVRRLRQPPEALPVPIWGLRDPALDGAPLRSSIEDLAEGYAEALERTFGDRRVHLAGWSLGGLLAYELARRVSAAGRPPLSLTLLDTLARPVPITGERQLHLLRAFADQVGAPFAALGLDPAEVKALPLERRLVRFGQAARAAGLLEDWSDRELQRRWRVYAAHADALQAYRPERSGDECGDEWDGEVLLVEATANPPGVPRCSEDWKPLLGDRLRVERMDTTHFGMLRGELAGRVAALLRRQLERTGDVQPAPPVP